MPRRQTIPRIWFLLQVGTPISAIRRLPRGTGVLLLNRLDNTAIRRLRYLTRQRRLTVVEKSPRSAARVHNMREQARHVGPNPACFLVASLLDDEPPGMEFSTPHAGCDTGQISWTPGHRAGWHEQTPLRPRQSSRISRLGRDFGVQNLNAVPMYTAWLSRRVSCIVGKRSRSIL